MNICNQIKWYMADPRMIADSAFAMACPLDVACTKHYNALCCLPFEVDAY